MRIIHNYRQNDVVLDHSQRLQKMVEMHLKYDNMHTNRIFNALNFINNHVHSCINYMLSLPRGHVATSSSHIFPVNKTLFAFFGF